ncbi:MAG: CHASE3 domain-containing protein [Pirellulales bacterium]
MRRAGYSVWVWLVFAATVLVIAVLGIVTYQNTTKLLSTDQLVAQTYHAREVAESMLSALSDAETGERGFLLTGDEKYLAPYDRGVANAKAKLAELRQLSPDDEVLNRQIDDLERIAAERLSQLQDSIALRRENASDEGFTKARELMVKGRGSQAMDEIRALFDEIQDHQRELLSSREFDASERADNTHGEIVAGHLLAIGMLFLAGLAMHVDRRRRGEAESQLETSEQQLSAIVDSAMDGIIMVDGHEQITFVNPAAEALIGCNHHSAIGQPIRRFVPATNRGSFADDLAEFVGSSLQSRRLDDRSIQRVDGTQVRVASALAKSEVEGQPFVTLMLRDLSEREAQKAKIREQSAVLDQVRDAIHVCDAEGQIVYWNHGAEQLYGWTAAEVLGRSAADVITSTAPDLTADAYRLTQEQMSWSGEITQRTKNGREIIVEERRTLIWDEAGVSNAQLVFDVDISERKRIEEHQRRAQRLESIGTLAGGIAHDLNNVLTPIMMGSKLLLRDQKEENRQKIARTIQAAAERGTEMIKQLLSFAGGKEGRRETVQVAEVIREVQDILEHTLPKSIDSHVDILDNLWPVVGDPTEICQLILNLCINARDAMPDGGHLTIAAENCEIDARRASANPDLSLGPHLMLSISDTGTGIAHDIIDKIFDPFFTTKEHGKGTGLGLATCLGIVRSHGGAINVYSEPNCGSEFTIYLPATPAAASATTESWPTESVGGNGELILLVDDEPMVLEIASATLEENGYRALIANSGAEAVEIYSRRVDEVAAAIVDMMMPGMDGISTMNALKGINPQIRVIASSGLRSRGREARTLAGALEFLPKPYSDAQLLSTLRRVLKTEIESSGVTVGAATGQ